MSNVVPIPSRLPRFAEPAGRVGDWWEPVASAAGVAGQLQVEADRRRLTVDLLAALHVERALVQNDIETSGLHAGAARAALANAAHGQPSAGPGCLHAGYLRMLRSGERGYERESTEQLARRDLFLPLRLHDAVRVLDLRGALDTSAVGEAVAWEIAAASNGQFMREWALKVLLARFAA
jgi:hypothetical protein